MVAPAKIEDGKVNDRVYLFSDMSEILKTTLDNINATNETVVDYNDPANWPHSLDIDVPIFREGRFDHWRYDILEFTVATLDKIIANFNAKIVPYDISFDMEHFYHAGALAWIKTEEGSLYRKEIAIKTDVGDKILNVLFARCTLNRKGVEKILGREVRYFSSEIHPDFSTNEIHTINVGNGVIADTLLSHGTTLVGGGFTNRPFIPGMPAAFSNRTFSTAELKNGLKFNETQTITLLVDSGSDKSFSNNSFGTFVTLDTGDVPNTTQSFSNNFNNNQAPLITTSDKTEGDKNMATILLSVLAAQLTGKTPEEQINLFSSNVENIAPAEKPMFDMIFNSIKNNADNDRVQARLAQEAELAKAEAVKLSKERDELKINLVKANEQGWQSQTKSFSQELSALGHHTAVVNEVERLFSNMPTDLRSQKFSVGDVQYDIKGMFQSVLSKLPKDALMNREFSLTNEANKENVVPVKPDTGATDGSNPTPPKGDPADPFLAFSEADRSKAKAFSKRYGSLPTADLMPRINADGSMNFG